MSAWSNWVGNFCFITALAVPILSGASLPVSAQDQQDQRQPQQQPLPSKSSHNWSRRLRFIPMLCWRRY